MSAMNDIIDEYEEISEGIAAAEAKGYKRGLREAAEAAEKEQFVLDNRGKDEAGTYFYRFAARLRHMAGE